MVYQKSFENIRNSKESCIFETQVRNEIVEVTYEYKESYIL